MLQIQKRARIASIVFCLAFTPLVAAAQDQPGALPTAPGAAEKAASGGYTGARASLAGDHGSPLEPYLFLAILAGGGLITWGAALTTDYRLRKSAG